jgi:hypothetical protein
VVVPLASALVAHRDHYFGVFGAYRAGKLQPLISSFATASRIAAAESRATAQRLVDALDEWADLLGRVRAGSAADKLLALLPARPVLSAGPLKASPDGARRLDSPCDWSPLTYCGCLRA